MTWHWVFVQYVPRLQRAHKCANNLKHTYVLPEHNPGAACNWDLGAVGGALQLGKSSTRKHAAWAYVNLWETGKWAMAFKMVTLPVPVPKWHGMWSFLSTLYIRV